VLAAPGLDYWLFPEGDSLVRKASLSASVGHHLQIPDGSVLTPHDGSGDAEIEVLTGHQDVSALLLDSVALLGSSDRPPAIDDLKIDLLVDDPLSPVRYWLLGMTRWWETADPDERRFVSLVKALVIAADLAGSALPRSGVDGAEWTREVLSRVCNREDLERLGIRGTLGKALRPFQERVARAEPRITLVRAGCGTGKTTAAYLWASRHAAARKLFFCYPTTGTTTEGYRDYVMPDDIEAALIHSRAEVDLEELAAAPDCEEDDRLRIEALAAWDVPMVVCTADTVLGLVQNSRRGLFSFPAIGNGAFVFDEVHAYDERMFGALLRFLDAFRRVPVLLMTASLPQNRLGALSDLAVRLRDTLVDVEGAHDLESIPRYRLGIRGVEDAWNEAAKVLGGGGKVLWVANTVERAVARAQEARARGLAPVHLYHSRYRYCDRVQKHRAIIEAFRRDAPALAITTQVCEISLDLSSDLLVTEMAPVPALIQRMGRLNRRVTVENPGEPKPALVLEPDSAAPYAKADLVAASRWIGRLGDEPVSQAGLARAFLEVADNTAQTAAVWSAWLDGGPFSAPAPLREPGTTIPVIRAEDGEAARWDRSQVVRLAIPMLLGPVINEIGRWPRLGLARLAPPGRINYSTEWGGTWRA
jgi:CRISPR-associated endonuclease/helicase Cas3